MENSLKQRIIGAVVLVALAVIFLPAILKDKASNGEFVSKIPEKPKALQDYKIDTKKIEQISSEQAELFIDNKPTIDELGTDLSDHISQNEINNEEAGQENLKTKQLNLKVKHKIADKQPEKMSTTKKLSQAKKSSSVKIKAVAEDNRSISQSYIDAAWVVQVASFSKENNATALVKKLKDKNYKAYRRKIKVSNQLVYRVFVGPYITKPLAKSSIKTINKVSETQSIVKVFDPIKH